MHPSIYLDKFFAEHSGCDQIRLSTLHEWITAQPEPIDRYAVERELSEWHVQGDIALIVIDGPTFIIPYTM